MKETALNLKLVAFQLLLLFSRAAAAAPAVLLETYVIADRPVSFTTYYDHLRISSTCLKGDGNLSCDARTAALQSSLRLLAGRDLRGGKNPGSILCDALRGEVVFGTHGKADENAFCQFKDGSLVDCGSLYYYGRMNDQIRGKKR